MREAPLVLTHELAARSPGLGVGPALSALTASEHWARRRSLLRPRAGG